MALSSSFVKSLERAPALAAKLHLRESFAIRKVYCLAGSLQGLSKYGRGILIKETSTCETSMRSLVRHGRVYACVGRTESTCMMALGVLWQDEGRCTEAEAWTEWRRR